MRSRRDEKARPRDDRVQDDGTAVDHGVLVIASRKTAPLLEVTVAALDHIAVLVVRGVEANRAAAAVSALDSQDIAGTAGLVGRTVADVERDLIIDTLHHTLGNRTHAANILGISIRTLRNKLKQYHEEGVAVPMPGEPERAYL